MLLVSLLPALLLSSKLKFYLLQSPYFPSFPLSFFFAFLFLPWNFYLFLPLRRSENFFVFVFFFFQKFTVSRWNKFPFHNFGISQCSLMRESEFILAVKVRCLLTFAEGSIHSWQPQEHRKRSVGNTLWSTWSMDLYNHRLIHNNPCAWFVRKTFLMKQWSRLGSSNIYRRFIPFFHFLRDQFLKRKTMNIFTSWSKDSDDSLKLLKTFLCW